MSGFSRRMDAPGPKKKASKSRAERSPKIEKKLKEKKSLKKTQVDSGARAAKGRQSKASQETGTGLDTRDGREG